MLTVEDFQGLEVGDQLELPALLPDIWGAPVLLTCTQVGIDKREFDVTVEEIYLCKTIATAKEGKVSWG